MFGFTEIEARTYLILAFCQFSSIAVNLLEQPYARSLVVCDTPVNASVGAAFSGSKFCGDSLHVIDAGAEISGLGQSLENFGRILVTLLVSSFADRGRKRVAMVGQCLIVASVILFCLASFTGAWGVPMYIVAQSLQGMSGISILDEIVTSDVALQLDDSVGVYNRKQTFNTASMAAFMPLIMYIQYAEFTDFTLVWLSILVFNVVALCLLVGVFPETLSNKARAAVSSNVCAEVRKELTSFWTLCKTSRFIRYRLLEAFMQKMWDWGPTIALPVIMAFFGYSQIKAMMMLYLPGFFVSILTMQLAPGLHKRFGYRPAFRWFYFFFITNRIGLNFVTTVSYAGLPVMLLFTTSFGIFAGWGGVVSAAEIRLVGQQNNARYKAMMQLITFASGTLTSYIYSATFEAQATTYIGQSVPMLISAVFCFASIPVFMYGTGPDLLEECDRMTLAERATVDSQAKKAA